MSAISRNSSPSARASSPSPSSLRGELLAVPQLAPAELDEIAQLAAACLAVDGGRLKLEWQALRHRPAGSTSDFIWLADGEVVGFIGIYQWRPIALELCGMVHPAWRRRGIGATLYEAAMAEVDRRAPARALLIVDRALVGGRRFALSRGGELDHSEHRMQQRREPESRSGAPLVRIRTAVRSDACFVSECVAAAFEEEAQPVDESDEAGVARLLDGTTLIEAAGSRESVGVLRVEREGGAASIYGFAVVPGEQGKGYGRAALSAVTRELHQSGVGVISLEVLSTNDSALHLYTTCGFDAIGTEDYYSMPVGD
ncbi:MAG: GNAT family N-acetyltransferase [Acidimicrobiales bacterium]